MVGLAVGLAVGLVVGDMVGDAVGDVVGDMEGESEGATVIDEAIARLHVHCAPFTVMSKLEPLTSAVRLNAS